VSSRAPRPNARSHGEIIRSACSGVMAFADLKNDHIVRRIFA
jgi:hypothetical protein